MLRGADRGYRLCVPSLPASTRIGSVAAGVTIVAHRGVNMYLVEDGDRIGLVDAGLPGSWDLLVEALRRIGHRPDDVAAVLVTHAHFDHVGCARRLQEEHGTPVLVHPGDAHLAQHPYRYRPARNRFAFAATHPGGWRPLAAMTAGGALRVRAPRRTDPLPEGVLEDFPGRPRVLATPGHTDGHVVVHLPDSDAVLTGDALVTLDPYTGRRGPRVVASGATNDPGTALRSLATVAATGARNVLPGHGAPWYDGATSAAEHARSAGVA